MIIGSYGFVFTELPDHLTCYNFGRNHMIVSVRIGKIDSLQAALTLNVIHSRDQQRTGGEFRVKGKFRVKSLLLIFDQLLSIMNTGSDLRKIWIQR